MEGETWSCDFVPVFDIRDNVYNSFYCRPKSVSDDGTVLGGEELLAQGLDEPVAKEKIIVNNMTKTINTAIRKANEFKLEGKNDKIIIPVNGSALCFKAIASHFTTTCRQYESDGENALVFEVTNVADSVTMSYLDDIAVVLYPFCMTYFARVPRNVTNFKIFSTCNYSGVSTSLNNKQWPVDKVAPYLEKLFKMTELCKLKAYIHGVATQEILDVVKGVGFRYVDGDAVTKLYKDSTA